MVGQGAQLDVSGLRQTVLQHHAAGLATRSDIPWAVGGGVQVRRRRPGHLSGEGVRVRRADETVGERLHQRHQHLSRRRWFGHLSLGDQKVFNLTAQGVVHRPEGVGQVRGACRVVIQDSV